MKTFFALLILIPLTLPAAPLDCTWNGGESIDVSAAADNTINCSTFTVNAGGVIYVHSGGVEGSDTVLTINVSGDVMIDETINLNGGSNGNPNRPGPGGFLGGTHPGGFANGNSGNGPTNSNGNGGIKHDENGNGFACGGGGGSGGRHSNTVAAGTDGTDTSGFGACNNTSGQDGSGGSIPPSTYGDPNNFFSTILGGTGGGAGGAGEDGAGTAINGARGGSGGGAIRIIADGDITLTTNATITANGEAGVDGGDGGSGGGGAGGAIYLATKGQITFQTGASLSAQGGAGGTSSGNGGSGSDGDDGYVRLEDSDGMVTGVSGNSTPSASFGVFGSTPIQTFESDISPGCAFRERKSSHLPIIIFFGVCAFMVLLTRIKSKINRSTIYR